MTSTPSRRSNRARWLWFFFKCACGLSLVACAVYGAIAYRYFTQEPRLARNFAAELNATILKTPEADRAWPLYRIALENLNRRLPSEIYVSDEYLECPDRKRFLAAARYAQNREILPLIKAAAARPKMGLVLSDQWIAEDLPWLKNVYDSRERTLEPASENPMLMAIVLPPLDEMKLFVEMLCFDAEEAASRGDGACLAEDLSAAIAIARHLREIPLVINDAASWRNLRLAMSILRWILVEDPNLLDENGLDLLTESLAKYSGGAPIAVRLATERMTFEDVVQRMYTDDGAGDGHILAHDTKFAVDGIVATPANMFFRDDWHTKLIAPIESWRSSGRREVMQRYNRYIGEIEVACAEPLWRRPSFPQLPDLGVPKQASGEFHRLLFLNFAGIYSLSKSAAQELGASLVGIALARYRLQHAQWPATLDEAPLSGMPDAMVDFHTGGRLRYRLVEDQPLLYSVGADKRDDNGRPPTDPAEYERAGRPAPRDDQGHAGDGDWILLPGAKPKVFEQLSEVS